VSVSVLLHGFHLRLVHTNQDHGLGTFAQPEVFQPLAPCLRRQNELINLAITQVVEFPPAVGVGALADHSIHRSILAMRLISPSLRDLFGKRSAENYVDIPSELVPRI
jgi:hypothetical protein